MKKIVKILMLFVGFFILFFSWESLPLSESQIQNVILFFGVSVGILSLIKLLIRPKKYHTKLAIAGVVITIIWYMLGLLVITGKSGISAEGALFLSSLLLLFILVLLVVIIKKELSDFDQYGKNRWRYVSRNKTAGLLVIYICLPTIILLSFGGSMYQSGFIDVAIVYMGIASLASVFVI